MADVQWAFISTATVALAHLLLRTILGRDLGPEGLGIYTLAFTTYLIGVQFAAFGTGSALTKFVAEHLEDRGTVQQYISSGMLSSIITGAAMGAILFLLAPFIAVSFFHTPALESMIQLTAVCYPFIAVQKAVLGTFNGFRRMKPYAFLNISQNVSIVVVSVLLVSAANMGVMGGVIGYVAPTILISALCPLMIRDWINGGCGWWNLPALRVTTAFGFYILLGDSIAYLNTQIDSILIGYYMSPTDVGIFSVAILFVQVLALIPSAVQQVTMPVTATMFGRGDRAGATKLFYATLKKSIVITLAIAVAIALAAPYIIPTLFSDDYLTAYLPLLILLPGYALGSSFIAVGATLFSIGKERIPFRISAVSVVLSVVLNIILIPYLGLYGAALATSITMAFNFALRFVVTKHLLEQAENTKASIVESL